MKIANTLSASVRRAFTLVEMLVVIAVIATLAAMIFPAFGMIKRRAAIQKAQTELKLVASAITDYKHQYGHYPPDNTCLPDGRIINQLYYELIGTELKGGLFQTLNGSVQIADTDNAFGKAFGTTAGKPCVRGFVNCKRGNDDDNSQPAKKFLIELKPTQYVQGINNGVELTLLTCSVQWPRQLPALISTFTVKDQGVNPNPYPNPWRYVSSNPTNNPGEFDLWVDIAVGGKTNRISNWSDKPLIVP